MDCALLWDWAKALHQFYLSKCKSGDAAQTYLLDSYFVMLHACSVYCRRPYRIFLIVFFKWVVLPVYSNWDNNVSSCSRGGPRSENRAEKSSRSISVLAMTSLKFEIDIYRTTSNCTFHIFSRSFLEAILLFCSSFRSPGSFGPFPFESHLPNFA